MDDLTQRLFGAQLARRAATGYASSLSASQRAGISGIASAYPSLGGTVLSFGAAGLSPADPAVRYAAVGQVQQQSATVQPGQQITGGQARAKARHGGGLGIFDLTGSVSSIFGGAEHAIKAVTNNVLKPVVKYGAAGAQFPIEYETAGYREALGGHLNHMDNTDAFTNMLQQTTVGAGVAEAHDRGQLTDMLLGRGDEKLSGNGWFIGPNTPTARRQASEARAALVVDGHAWTPGRGLAHAVRLDEGSWGYKALSGAADLAYNVFADPTAIAGTKVAKANRLRDVIALGKATVYETPVKKPIFAVGVSGETGLVDGMRQTVIPERAAQWLDSKAGNKVASGIAGIAPDDPEAFNKIWRGSNKQLPVELVTKMVDETDPVQVKGLIADAISKGDVRDGLNFRVRKPPPRIAGMMPGAHIDLEDMDDAVEQLDRFQRNARIPEATISKHNYELATALGKGSRFDVVRASMNTVQDTLRANGMERDAARRVTRMFEDALETNRKYFVDEIGDNAYIPGVTLDRVGEPLPSPHLLVELLDRYIPLPNARDIKTAARSWDRLRKVQQSTGYKAGRDSLDFVTNALFKVGALALRPAWAVRVVGEEQLRMSAAGLDSAFHHPLSYIGIVAGDKPNSRLGKVLGGGRYTEDALGTRYRDEVGDGVSDFLQALNHGTGGWKDKTVGVQLRHWDVFDKSRDEYLPGWHEELSQLAADPIAREVARNGAVRTKRAFWQGNLQGFRREIGEANPDSMVHVLREQADAYIDSVAERVRVKTGSHPDLIDAVATGKLRGHSLTADLRPAPRARQELGKLIEHGPDKVKARMQASAGETATHAFVRHYDNATDWMFYALGTVPTNRLSRSVVFRQRHWQRIEELIPQMAKNDRYRAIRQAKAAGVPKGQVDRMLRSAKAQDVNGTLSLEDADSVAKRFALNKTRDLLYSLHEKSQAADALRVVYPFGEAWREVLTRWAKLGNPITGNPNALYRSTSLLQNGQGTFFYTDPVTGQEMVGIPGSEWITKHLIGVPMRMEMPLQGFNMFGTITPGVGPGVSLPASKLLPDNPRWDWVRSQVFPMGEPDTGSGVLEQFMPAYVRKLQVAFNVHPSPEQQRQKMAVVKDVMAYLASTGNYDLSNPDEQQRLLDDAKGKARWVFLIRGLAQAGAPSSPQVKFGAEDKTGRLHALYELQADYQKMLKKDPAKATERFVTKWGMDNIIALIGDTTGGVQPQTSEVSKLARSHPGVAERFPDVFGLFAKDSDKFSFDERERQINTGTVTVVTPELAKKMANQRLAQVLYNRARDKGETPEALWALRDRLMVEYPGWTALPSNLDRIPSLIAQLTRASKDETLAGTDAGEGLRDYLQARSQIVDQSRAAGINGWQQANATYPQRLWLWQTGQFLASQHPDFAGMWERVLSRELGA